MDLSNEGFKGSPLASGAEGGGGFEVIVPVNPGIEESVAPASPPATAAPGPIRHDVTLLTSEDLHLFNEGNHCRSYRKLGAHSLVADGEPGTYFAV